MHASGQLYTVADAVADYVEYLRIHRKSADDSEAKLTTYSHRSQSSERPTLPPQISTSGLHGHSRDAGRRRRRRGLAVTTTQRPKRNRRRRMS
jgi:hypothetical protein